LPYLVAASSLIIDEFVLSHVPTGNSEWHYAHNKLSNFQASYTVAIQLPDSSGYRRSLQNLDNAKAAKNCPLAYDKRCGFAVLYD